MSDNSTKLRIPDWVLGWHPGLELPYGGQVWHPLQSLLTESTVVRMQNEKISHLITVNIQELLSPKLSTISKFGNLSAADLMATLGEDSVVAIRVNKSAEDISHHFAAVGERFVLYLSITAAVRQILMIQDPFESDSGFLRFLDVPLAKSCQKFVEKLSLAPQILE